MKCANYDVLHSKTDEILLIIFSKQKILILTKTVSSAIRLLQIFCLPHHFFCFISVIVN